MSIENQIDLVRAWVEQVWNGGDLERLAAFHPPAFDNEGRRATIEETMQWHSRTRLTFPDIHYTIEDIFAAGDRVAVRWTATATHRGPLWGMIPPTGKTITWTGMHLLRIVDRQIVEVWAQQNSVAQLRQMGVTLQPASQTTEPDAATH